MNTHHHSVLTGAPLHPDEELLDMHAEALRLEARSDPAVIDDPSFEAAWAIRQRMLAMPATTFDGMAAKMYTLLEMNTVDDLLRGEPEPVRPEEVDGWDRAMFWSLWRDLKALKPDLWGALS